MVKLIKDNNEYYLPVQRKNLTASVLATFLEKSISTYSAAQILFKEQDYTLSLIDYPTNCAKFSNIFLTSSNVKMPSFETPELYNEKVLFYFPIEWIEEHFIKSDIAIMYHETYDSFYLKRIDTFSAKKENIENCFFNNLQTLKFAIENDKVDELYKTYVNFINRKP